jgi:hypothetical protein
LFLLFTSLIFLCRRRCFFFLALAFSSQPRSASPSHAHQEGCAQSEDGEEREQQDGSQVGSFVEYPRSLVTRLVNQNPLEILGAYDMGALLYPCHLEIARSDEIRSCAPIFFRTVSFRRERGEALLSVSIMTLVLLFMVKSVAENDMKAEFLRTCSGDLSLCGDDELVW